MTRMIYLNDGSTPTPPKDSTGDITREIIEKANEVKREFNRETEPINSSPPVPPQNPADPDVSPPPPPTDESAKLRLRSAMS